MRKLVFISLMMCFWCIVRAQEFPSLTGKTLSGKELHLPHDFKNKKAVIVIAASPKAEQSLKQWSQPLYNALIAEGMGGLMGARMYDAHLCFAGLVKGIAKLAFDQIIDKGRKKVDKKFHDLYFFSDQEVPEFLKAAEISHPEEPYFFVLDKDGKIIYRTSGAYSDDKLNAITEKLL